MAVVYVVSIPYDSASVSHTHVFKRKKDAEEFCAKKNGEGYNGYAGGLSVEECEVIT